MGWALSSAAVALAVVGGCLWLSAAARRRARALAPIVALGATSLTFYVVQFLYLDTVWIDVQPLLTTTATSLLGSVAFWLVFALLAQHWLRHFARGPLEGVLHAGALAITWPWRARRERKAAATPVPVGPPSP